MKALILAATLLGCSADAEPDLPMTEVEGREVLSQAAWWSTYTDDAHQVACPDPQICLVAGKTWTIHKRRTVAEWCRESLGCGGVTLPVHRELLIAQQRDVGNFGLMIRHEIGHALGMHHTATGVMQFPFHDPSATPEVLEECRTVGAC